MAGGGLDDGDSDGGADGADAATRLGRGRGGEGAAACVGRDEGGRRKERRSYGGGLKPVNFRRPTSWLSKIRLFSTTHVLDRRK